MALNRLSPCLIAFYVLIIAVGAIILAYDLNHRPIESESAESSIISVTNSTWPHDNSEGFTVRVKINISRSEGVKSPRAFILIDDNTWVVREASLQHVDGTAAGEPYFHSNGKTLSLLLLGIQNGEYHLDLFFHEVIHPIGRTRDEIVEYIKKGNLAVILMPQPEIK